MPDNGAIVCSCFSVGTHAIRRAIAQGADTVAALGQRTCAGTNCGSCKPELAAFLAAIPARVAAE
jgi:assimilatory nitrate reductase catalytic subunit